MGGCDLSRQEKQVERVTLIVTASPTEVDPCRSGSVRAFSSLWVGLRMKGAVAYCSIRKVTATGSLVYAGNHSGLAAGPGVYPRYLEILRLATALSRR